MSEFNIEHDIMSKSGWTPEKKYRKRQDFLAALLRAACSMSNEAYDGLGEMSDTWVQQAAKVHKHNKEHPDDHQPLPDFNGHDAESDDHQLQGNDDDSEQGVDEVSEAPEGQEASADDAGGVGTNEQTETKKPKKRVVKAKTAKVVKAKKEKAPSRGLNEWGVVKGTKSDRVCQMLAHPDGTTQKAISEAVGQTHYNLVNRLQRRGHTIKYDGTKIWLLRKEQVASSGA